VYEKIVAATWKPKAAAILNTKGVAVSLIETFHCREEKQSQLIGHCESRWDRELKQQFIKWNEAAGI
jgi:hypothetical protein